MTAFLFLNISRPIKASYEIKVAMKRKSNEERLDEYVRQRVN